jgi:hypothetical protein
VPDLPPGAEIYIESKSTSDEAVRFQSLLQSKLAETENRRGHFRPGFSIVSNKKDATYTLRYVFILRTNVPSCDILFGCKPGVGAMVDASLFDASDHPLWSEEYHCGGVAILGEPVSYCARLVANDLKGAQIDAKGKRAGLMGWKTK